LEWIYKKGLIIPPTIATLYLYPKALYDIILLEHSGNSENKPLDLGLKSELAKAVKC
jgi:hypothetical protein